ncbi:hypothetical protein PoB_005687300 [Plakobranchus ocellatus]|uniref:Uncharacterized protein n=1 Tax=Plakobranchus ocellatus TaxID=259542 RepID=A0AAV4CEK6_9GAST|nr:hypothetical protein PoB_005687300 [Plakobranchus ocellatus]
MFHNYSISFRSKELRLWKCMIIFTAIGRGIELTFSRPVQQRPDPVPHSMRQMLCDRIDWDDELGSNPELRCEDAGERDKPRGGLYRRPVGPYSNLRGLRENPEGALQAAATGKLYRETNKVRAWHEDDRLPWLSAWRGSIRSSGREHGEILFRLRQEISTFRVEKVCAAPRRKFI